MATLKLSEVIVDAAIAKLRNGIAARIAAVNQGINDHLSVEAPVDIFPFGLPGELAAAPCYVVTVFGESPAYTGDGPHGFVYRETIGVMIVEEDPDRESVGRKLLRHRRAVLETLWDDPPREALEGSAYTLTPYRHIVGPTFDVNVETSQWRSYFLQLFVAEQQEGD